MAARPLLGARFAARHLAALTALTALIAGLIAATPAGAVSGTVMTVQSQNLRQPYAWQDPCCFGVDNFMSWTVTGQIAPGDSYTFVPRWPTSQASEIPAMSASVRWSGATTLRMSSSVPMNDEVSAADPRVDHVGEAITAPTVGNSAALCMFFVPNASLPTFSYAVTITNVGTAAATGVTLTGQEANGYTANFAPFCNHADADGDGWNDTLEEGIADLTAPATTTPTEQFTDLASDYLAGHSATSTRDDEVDTYPADVNDDGVVDKADVDRISAWVGQGTGVPFARVDFSGLGPDRYQVQTGQWRRYDLDGDGLVTANDVAWVSAEVDRPVPDAADVIAPWVVFDPATPTSVPRRSAVFLGAYARDNRALTAVRFYANGSALTQQCTDPMTEMNNPDAYHNPAQPQYECVWNTPGKRATVTLTVTATDAAGHSVTATQKVTVS
jgi:Dockerin type I domain